MNQAQKYNSALRKIVTAMQTEFGADLLGMLLGGSVAYGFPAKRSDLDIYVIIRHPWRQRRTLFVDEVEVELFINPPHKIREEFKKTEHPATLSMFARGKILYDPNGLIAELVGLAKQIWQGHRPVVAEKDQALLRYGPTDMLKDAQDLAESDPEIAIYQIVLTLQTTLDVYYKLQRHWSVKSKHLFLELGKVAPEIEKQARTILAGNLSAVERCEHLEKLVAHVLHPIGGLLGEWESERLPVADSE